jgi:hypothetical protein
MSPPTLVGRHIVFVLSVRLSVTHFVSATPLKLLNRISWHLVGSKDTICSCAYYQEIVIAWILWELCPFELRNFPKFPTEAACGICILLCWLFIIGFRWVFIGIIGLDTVLAGVLCPKVGWLENTGSCCWTSTWCEFVGFTVNVVCKWLGDPLYDNGWPCGQR